MTCTAPPRIDRGPPSLSCSSLLVVIPDLRQCAAAIQDITPDVPQSAPEAGLGPNFLTSIDPTTH